MERERRERKGEEKHAKLNPMPSSSVIRAIFFALFLRKIKVIKLVMQFILGNVFNVIITLKRGNASNAYRKWFRALKSLPYERNV